MSIKDEATTVSPNGQQTDVIRWVDSDTPPPNVTKQYLVCRNGKVELHDWFYRDGLGYWWNYLGITHWAEVPKPPCG